MDIKQTKKQNFGWNCKTHYILTKTIAENIPALKRYATPLAISSLTPDIKLSQTSLGYNMAHYFDGKNFNSYDIVPQNASDFYFDNLSKGLGYLRDGFNFIGIIKTGNALHFLQDMAVPLHTNPKCFDRRKIFKHIKYESIPSQNPDIIRFIIGKEPPKTNMDFHDCFIDTYKKSSQMENPYKIPVKEWAESVQMSLENAYEHTYLFLKRLAGLLDVPIHKKQEVFPNEVFSFWKEVLKDEKFAGFRSLYKKQADV